MARRKTTQTLPSKLSRLSGATDRDSMARWAERYLEWLSVRNYSPVTVSAREVYLALFIHWCEERSLLHPQEITKPILERYQRALFHQRMANGRPLTFRTQRGRLTMVRCFFKWLTRQNVLLYNPASEIELPKNEHRLPRHVLTVSEVESVLNLPDVREVFGIRDRAILEVFYATGMRRGELVALGAFDVDVGRQTAFIRQGKGRKDRLVPLGERAGAWVEKYLYEARPTLVVGVDEPALFLTSLGEAFTPGRVSQLVRGYVNAGVEGKTGSCHLFRHTAATLMLDGGADIRHIQELLGHSELSTTQVYTQVSIQKLQAVHRMTHPGATLERPVTKPASEDAVRDPEAERVAMFSLLAAESEAEGGEHAEGDDIDCT